MKRISQLIITLLACTATHAQKQLYIPQDLQHMNLLCDTSTWSYSRMHCTDNFAVMWQKGFGMDLSKAPQLDGNPMTVDLQNLTDRLESYYAFFRDSLQFTRTGSNADKYRMLVMLNYTLEGTAYGGDYDGKIGALWVSPNRLQDKKLNCIAHELGHSFQSQITCDGEGEAWGGCGFFEMTSQWMLWQVNPNWISDEQYHFDAFTNTCHKAFLHLENIYRSPYVIECWGEKHGKTFIAELYRQGKRGEDPAMTYKRLTGMTQGEFCDEMFHNVSRMVNMDFPRTWRETRKYAGRFSTPLEPAAEGWQRISPDRCPEDYGFNIIKLSLPAAGRAAKVRFRGIANAKGYNTGKGKGGWRYGLVGIGTNGHSVYGEMQSAPSGTATLKTPKTNPLRELYLVVMGAPASHNPGSDAQWPYEIKTGTSPENKK